MQEQTGGLKMARQRYCLQCIFQKKLNNGAHILLLAAAKETGASLLSISPTYPQQHGEITKLNYKTIISTGNKHHRTESITK
jgi:hypothetical protein